MCVCVRVCVCVCVVILGSRIKLQIAIADYQKTRRGKQSLKGANSFMPRIETGRTIENTYDSEIDYEVKKSTFTIYKRA